MQPHRVKHELCSLCLLCREVCGRGIFTLEEGRLTYAPEGRCIDCGHCLAVCPEAALVREDKPLPPALEDQPGLSADSLLHFLRSRRSIRKFKKRLPEQEILEKLADAARFAPTGTNKQDVRIVMVTDPALLEDLRQQIMGRYRAYERHLANPLKRFLLKTFVDKRLGDPAIRSYLAGFMDKFRAGADPLFHFAPVVVLLHTGAAATTGKDDCVLALYHMLLMAETLGLGSCLLGTVEAALARTPRLNHQLGIPREQKVLASACFGYPKIAFQRLTDRNPPDIRWL